MIKYPEPQIELENIPNIDPGTSIKYKSMNMHIFIKIQLIAKFFKIMKTLILEGKKVFYGGTQPNLEIKI